MRIAHINLSPPGNGGIENLLVDFIRSGRHYGMDVEVCVLGSLNEFSQELIEQNYKIIAFNRKTVGFDASLLFRLARHLNANKFDIVHIHGTTGLIFGAIASILSGGQTTVYTCHFSESNHSWLKHRFLGFLLGSIGRKIAVSNAAKKVLVDKYFQCGHDIEVIYNGVDLAQFSPSGPHAEDILQIGFCGVLRPEKQVPVLIRSFACLIREGINARLSIVGDGVEMARCVALVRELDLGDAVVFHGYQKNVRSIIKDIDIFCLPSNQEAMPVALLEAMALGCCVIGSNVGGIPEVIEHGKSGLLIDSGSPTALTDSLRQLAADSALRKTLGQAARQCIEQKFHLSLMLKNYSELYSRMI